MDLNPRPVGGELVQGHAPLLPDQDGLVTIDGQRDFDDMFVHLARLHSQQQEPPRGLARFHAPIKGERVAAIVSESTLAMAQLLTVLLTSEMAASALPAVLPAAFPWARSLPDTDTHLKAFASELREAVVAESPERVGRVLDDWQAVAEVRAGERST